MSWAGLYIGFDNHILHFTLIIWWIRPHTPRTYQTSADPLLKSRISQREHDNVSERLVLNSAPVEQSSPNQTRSPVMIVPAYATAHMSQILIYWTRGESTAFLNRSSKHFRCVPLRFPIAILWEFNLIPTDISPGTVFQKKKKKERERERERRKEKKNETKKLGQIEEDFFFSLIQERWGIWVSLSLSLSIRRSLSLRLSVHFYRDYFILFAGALAVLAIGLRGLLWTNPPQSQ